MLRKDKQATMDMKYIDPRSYVANWKHPGTDHPCEYLFGEDKSARRKQIFERAKGRCQLETFVCRGARGLNSGEWHHLRGGLGKQRCDCMENGLWSCGPCHRLMHVAVKWNKRIVAGEWRTP